MAVWPILEEHFHLIPDLQCNSVGTSRCGFAAYYNLAMTGVIQLGEH